MLSKGTTPWKVIRGSLLLLLVFFLNQPVAARYTVLVRTRATSSTTRCVSEIPWDLLYGQEVLNEGTVKQALGKAQSMLESTYSDQNPSVVSLAVVHASKQEPIFTFSHGALRLNETKSGASYLKVDSDSIFRVDSISKAIVALSAMILQNQTASLPLDKRVLWSTRVAEILPEFSLPEADWENGGKDITLGMLASEISGLRREGYANGFDLRSNDTRATTLYLGKLWSSLTPAHVLNFTRTKGLLWSPGERPSYSNAGFSILGYAIANYLRQNSDFTGHWSDAAKSQILSPLNMTHSFFGAIPSNLKQFVSVPGVPSWIDLVIHAGYDPASGMFSSVNDLVKIVHHVYLKRSPELISAAQRRLWMRPNSLLDDGQQAVGPGWEIQHIHTTDDFATYETYGKEGDGGGQHSYFDALPALSYGLVILESEAKPTNATSTAIANTPYPVSLALELHNLLAPAFRKGYSSLLIKNYAGTYHAAAGHIGTATLQVTNESLHLASMMFDGVNALRRIDELSWTPDNQPILFSAKGGPSLHPSSISNTWHMAIDGETCDWGDFDGYTDANGDPVDGITLTRTEKGMKLTYPPLDAVFYRAE